MELRILGGLEVRHDAAVVAIRRGLPRRVLAWLGLRAREVVPADVLIDRLWGDDLPSNPTNALQTQISYLRKVLGHAVPGGDAVLATSGSGYRLDLDDDAIDATRFERAVEDACRGGRAPADALQLLDDALALWRGDPLAEIADHPAAAGEVTRLQELRIEALEARADRLLELGRHAEVVGDLGQVVADHPLHERFHGQLMLALYRSGRQAEALRAFEHARRLLADELGLDVSPDLRGLEAQILAHADDLVWLPSTTAVAATAVPSSRPAPARIPAPVTALIGRDADAAQVGELLGRSRLVTLTGPGGAGKTRLAVEVAQRIATDGSPVWFVDLGGVDDGGDVGVAVAAQLQVTTTPGDDVDEAVAAALAADGGLLVLDTCEHVIQGAARLAALSLRTAARLRILATSRRPLSVAGELAWPVPPLALP
ncbi:MAG: BTAD domain-containing putative transcriptional regulator, partial [Actinomycetota bacterium]